MSKKGRKTPLRGGAQRLASHPPQFNAQIVRNFHLRTLSTAALASVNFTITDLAGLVGVIANTATTARTLSQQFRLIKIEIWGPVAVAGTPVQVAVRWNNSANDFVGPPIQILDTGVSFDWPAYVSTAPPSGSLSSKWHDSTETDVTFSLTCPTGSTVDFHFDWVLSDLGNQNFAPAIAGATIGEVYHVTTHALVPQGVNTL